MANFTQLKALQVTSKNVKDFDFPELGAKAVLKLRSSNEGNSGYMNGLLRLTGQSKGSRRRKATDINAQAMDDLRDHDKELYPEWVIVGWEGVLDGKGKEVEYSVDEVKSLVGQLPNWLFDEIRAFVNDPANFVDQIDSEEIGKN